MSDTVEHDTVELREQDRWLPIANVDRVMRSALPANSKISKDAKESMQECVSEFISFITSQAAEKCLVEKRKTLNGEDILYALHSLGFENYAQVLRIYLAKYRIFELDEVEKRRAKYLARKSKLQKEKKEKKRETTNISTSTSTSNFNSNSTSTQPYNVPVYWDNVDMQMEMDIKMEMESGISISPTSLSPANSD